MKLKPAPTPTIIGPSSGGSVSLRPVFGTGPQGPAGADGADGVDGTDGTDGVDGLPGVNAVANDTATATYITTPGSDTNTALTASIDSRTPTAELGIQTGVDPTGATDCAAAINTALNGMAALGVRAHARGTYKIGSTVTVKDNADLSDATFNWVGTGTGVAVQVGPGGSGVYISNKRISLPRVINTKKTVYGWAESGVAGTTGVKAINLDACTLTVPLIQDFETGLHLYGEGQGTVYSTIHLGTLYNNKVQNLLSADATGWCNENKIRGGKMSYNSSEGSSVSGTRCINIPVTTSLVNNNVWDAVSIEGNVAEFHVECGGINNEWHVCRWENATGCRVKWITPAADNQIVGGYRAEIIVVTLGASANPQNIISAARWDFANQSTGGATSTGYSTRVDYLGLHIKPVAQSYDRVFIETSTGKVWLGTGAATPVCNFAAISTSGIGLYGGNLYSGTDATYDIGLNGSLRFRDIWLSRDANIGRNAKALAFLDTTITPTFAAGQVIAFATGALAVLTMTGNITSLGFTGGTTGGLYEVHFVQDATGSRTLTGAASSIKWAGGAPTLTTTAGKRDIFRFRYDGTNYYEVTRSMNVG